MDWLTENSNKKGQKSAPSTKISDNKKDTIKTSDFTHKGRKMNLKIIDHNYKLPFWVYESPQIGSNSFIKVSKNKKGVKDIEGENQLCRIPKEVFDTLNLEGVPKQNAYSALLLWGLRELKRQNKTLVIDFTDL